MSQCIFVTLNYTDFGPSAEVSREVANATFHDTSIERPLLLFKITMSKSSVFLSDNGHPHFCSVHCIFQHAHYNCKVFGGPITWTSCNLHTLTT